MFTSTEEEENKNIETRKRKSDRLSSILKSRSPQRNILQSLDFNIQTEEEGLVAKKSRPIRRVSFAETCQVKEFDNSNTALNIRLENQEIFDFEHYKQSAHYSLSCSDQKVTKISDIAEIDPDIEGLDTLLTGMITTNLSPKSIGTFNQQKTNHLDVTNIQSLCMETTFCEGNIYLPDSSTSAKLDPSIILKACMNETMRSIHDQIKTSINFNEKDDSNMKGLDSPLTGKIEKNLNYQENVIKETDRNAINVETLPMDITLHDEEISIQDSFSPDEKLDPRCFLKAIETNRLKSSKLYVPTKVRRDPLLECQSRSFTKFMDSLYNPNNQTNYETLINTSINKYATVSQIYQEEKNSLSSNTVSDENQIQPSFLDSSSKGKSTKHLNSAMNLHEDLSVNEEIEPKFCGKDRISKKMDSSNIIFHVGNKLEDNSNNVSLNKFHKNVITNKQFDKSNCKVQILDNRNEERPFHENNSFLIDKIESDAFLSKFASRSCESPNKDSSNKYIAFGETHDCLSKQTFCEKQCVSSEKRRLMPKDNAFLTAENSKQKKYNKLNTITDDMEMTTCLNNFIKVDKNINSSTTNDMQMTTCVNNIIKTGKKCLQKTIIFDSDTVNIQCSESYCLKLDNDSNKNDMEFTSCLPTIINANENQIELNNSTQNFVKIHENINNATSDDMEMTTCISNNVNIDGNSLQNLAIFNKKGGMILSNTVNIQHSQLLSDKTSDFYKLDNSSIKNDMELTFCLSSIINGEKQSKLNYITHKQKKNPVLNIAEVDSQNKVNFSDSLNKCDMKITTCLPNIVDANELQMDLNYLVHNSGNIVEIDSPEKVNRNDIELNSQSFSLGDTIEKQSEINCFAGNAEKNLVSDITELHSKNINSNWDVASTVKIENYVDNSFSLDSKLTLPNTNDINIPITNNSEEKIINKKTIPFLIKNDKPSLISKQESDCFSKAQDIDVKIAECIGEVSIGQCFQKIVHDKENVQFPVNKSSKTATDKENACAFISTIENYKDINIHEMDLVNVEHINPVTNKTFIFNSSNNAFDMETTTNLISDKPNIFNNDINHSDMEITDYLLPDVAKETLCFTEKVKLLDEMPSFLRKSQRNSFESCDISENLKRDILKYEAFNQNQNDLEHNYILNNNNQSLHEINNKSTDGLNKLHLQEKVIFPEMSTSSILLPETDKFTVNKTEACNINNSVNIQDQLKRQKDHPLNQNSVAESSLLMQNNSDVLSHSGDLGISNREQILNKKMCCNRPILIDTEKSSIDMHGTNTIGFVKSAKENIYSSSTLPEIVLNNATTNFTNNLDSDEIQRELVHVEIKEVSLPEIVELKHFFDNTADCDDQLLNGCQKSNSTSSVLEKSLYEIKTVDRLLVCLAVKNRLHKQSRVSMIPYTTSTEKKSLEDLLITKHKILPELYIYESDLDNLQKQLERLEFSVTQAESNMNESILYNLTTIVQNYMYEKSEIEAAFSICMKMAIKNWKEWKEESVKQINELFKKEEKILTDSCDELNIHFDLVSSTIFKMEKCKEYYEKRSLKLKESISIIENKKLAIEELNVKIENIMKELGSQENKQKKLQEEKKKFSEYQKICETLQVSEDTKSNSQIIDKAANLFDLRHHFSKLERLESCFEWKIEEWNDIGAKFLFFDGNLLLDIRFDGENSSINKTINNIHLSSMFEEKLSSFGIIDYLIFNSIDMKKLLDQHKSTSTLLQLLNVISDTVSRARSLLSELEEISTFQKIVIEDQSICVEFSCLKAFVKFQITFIFHLPAYPFCSLKFSLQPLIGNVRSEELNHILSSISPGWSYFNRLVNAVNLNIKMESSSGTIL